MKAPAAVWPSISVRAVATASGVALEVDLLGDMVQRLATTFLGIVVEGGCASILDGKLSASQATSILFGPRMLDLVTRVGVDSNLILAVMEATEIEDILELIGPEELARTLDEVSSGVSTAIEKCYP